MRYIYDGQTIKSLDHALPGGDDWFDPEAAEAPPLSMLHAWRRVPFLHRCVDLRCKALADMPWELVPNDGASRDDGRQAQAERLAVGMRERLYRTEGALCLYGAAYWLKQHNRVGDAVGLRWLHPSSIAPQYDDRLGLCGYQRLVGEPHMLTPGDLVAFWLPNLSSELGPGVAPAAVALAAAGVIYHLDQFAEAFFRRGAVKVTLLTVEGNPSRAELDRLQVWWRRVVAGIRRAATSVAVRSSVKPVVIGEGLEALHAETLTRQRREDVCAALGVPHSLLSASAATYATARQDRLNFYQQTIIPEARLVEEALNGQLFRGLGLRFRFLAERLEAFGRGERSEVMGGR